MLYVAGVSSFSLMPSVPLYKYATIHFIHPPIEWHLGYFQFVTIIDNIAISIFECLFGGLIYTFFGINSQEENCWITGYMWI